LAPKETDLADKLVEALSGGFHPEAYQKASSPWA